MSQEDVELVLRLQPPAEVDLARLFRDDERWRRLTEAAAPFYHSDFETIGTMLAVQASVPGMDGLRALWLDWLAPWATYRTQATEAVDLGDRVLLLSNSFGRLEGSTHEVTEAPASIWTVRDQKIARAEFYSDRVDALSAAGLDG